MKVDAMILAGARNEGPFREYSSQKHEALIKINDIPMAEYVIRAVKNANSIDRVALIGPQQALNQSLSTEVDLMIKSEESMVGNIRAGVENLISDKYILIVTSDIPLISQRVIDYFIDQCLQEEGEIFFPIIPREICENEFPGVERTYVKLADGTYTGGNIILIKSQVLFEILETIKKFIRWRKKPWKLSKLLGFSFIIKYICGILTLEEIEERITEIVGYKGKAIKVDYPEIGFDIDKPSDLHLIREKYSSLL